MNTPGSTLAGSGGGVRLDGVRLGVRSRNGSTGTPRKKSNSGENDQRELYRNPLLDGNTYGHFDPRYRGGLQKINVECYVTGDWMDPQQYQLKIDEIEREYKKACDEAMGVGEEVVGDKGQPRRQELLDQAKAMRALGLQEVKDEAKKEETGVTLAPPLPHLIPCTVC